MILLGPEDDLAAAVRLDTPPAGPPWEWNPNTDWWTTSFTLTAQQVAETQGQQGAWTQAWRQETARMMEDLQQQQANLWQQFQQMQAQQMQQTLGNRRQGYVAWDIETTETQPRREGLDNWIRQVYNRDIP